jgi:hypothetical protein
VRGGLDAVGVRAAGPPFVQACGSVPFSTVFLILLMHGANMKIKTSPSTKPTNALVPYFTISCTLYLGF